MNCVAINSLSNLSLGSLNKWLYFLIICINHIQIHTATQIIYANANNETLKLTEIQNITENINTESELQNHVNHELKVSWNDPKIEQQTWIKLVHKK